MATTKKQKELEKRLEVYYITAILSIIVAVAGFSYNTWRLEVSEANNNIRTASFELLTNLAQLEQIIYAAHYDKNIVEGSPRKGWVKIGLIVDLSSLISIAVEKQALNLKEVWSENWEKIPNEQALTNKLINKIEAVRAELKLKLLDLD